MPLVAPFQPEVAKHARMFNRNVLKNQDPQSASLIAELGILCPSSSRSLGDQDPDPP
jgi:hypothetical protein